MEDNKIRFTPYEIKDCLMDKERTLNLRKAIEEQVKMGDIVVEAGGGTGILSIFALLAGAKHAYIIELSGRFTTYIRKIAKANGLEDRVTVINGDATLTDVPEKADVYISELLCTGLFNEPQIQAYNNLRHFMKNDAVYIPQSVESHIAFCETERKVFGVKIDFDSYLAQDVIHERRTDFSQYMDIKFDGEYVNPLIHHQGSVTPLNIGVINSSLIVSSAMLSDTVKAEKTKFLFNPEIVFFENKWTMGTDISEATTTVVPDHSIFEHCSVVDYDLEYMAGGDTLDMRLRVF